MEQKRVVVLSDSDRIGLRCSSRDGLVPSPISDWRANRRLRNDAEWLAKQRALRSSANPNLSGSRLEVARATASSAPSRGLGNSIRQPL
jgi:hypothetical protein